jgi:hypothetical protein
VYVIRTVYPDLGAAAHLVHSLTADDVNAAVDRAGDLASLLKGAEREARARLYRTLGLQLLLGCSYVVAGAGFEPATFGL